MCPAVNSATENAQLGPAVSIIIPTYNRAALVAEAVVSAIDAGRGLATEIIVIDDGSTDDTEQQLKAFGDQIRYHRIENRGVSAARNAGLRLANARFIRFLDSDDRLVAGSTLALYQGLQASPADAILGLCGVFDNQGILRQSPHHGIGISGGGPPVPDQLFGSVVQVGSVLFLRRTLEKIGGFDEQCTFGEDYDLFLRGLLAGWSIVTVPVIACTVGEDATNRLTKTDTRSGYRYLATLAESRRHEFAQWDEPHFTEKARSNFGQFLWRTARDAARLGYKEESLALFETANRVAGARSRLGNWVMKALYRLMNPYSAERVAMSLKRVTGERHDPTLRH